MNDQQLTAALISAGPGGAGVFCLLQGLWAIGLIALFAAALPVIIADHEAKKGGKK